MGRARDDEDDDYHGFELTRVALFVVPLAAAAAFALHWVQRPTEDQTSLAWSDDARREVQSIVERRYVEPMTPARSERMFDAAMKGYVEDLDPFSRYFTRRDRTALDEDTSGKFGGIGIRVDPAPAGLLIIAVRKGGPADAMGVQPGETLERVDDTPLTGRDREAMIDMIKGPPGTAVELWLRPAGGGEVRRVTATRAQVELDTVPAVRTIEGASRLGYLRLAQFSDTTGAEAREALRTLVAERVAGLVLDLRRNLGGVVQAAVDVASLFLPPGTVVCTARARDGSHAYRIQVKDDFQPLALPLVVLVDESSASASEILAGALQDHGRAVLVGERTYGKFVMQTIVPLTNRGAMLRLTTARYETPRGRSDQRDPSRNLLGGLQPDVRVPLESRDEEDALRIEFARQAGPAWRGMPPRGSTPGPPDRQLGVAVDLLLGGVAPSEPVPPRAN